MKNKKRGLQKDTLPQTRPNDLDQMSFNLDKQDQFIVGQGVKLIHYRAIPSPIGLKDRGEYRRTDSVDTMSENGMIYKACGEFTAVFLGNNKSSSSVEGGFYDQSTARITLPRFYDQDSPSHAEEEINLCVGDRVFIKELDVRVINYQRVQYNPNGSDFLRYPALCIEILMDSRGIEYKEGVDFKINKIGNIEWIDGRKNPGIDPDTGCGRVYSVRYKYSAHWYIISLPNEIRMTNTTVGGIRKPARMPYHAYIQREYVYHNRSNGDEKETNQKTETPRTVPKPEVKNTSQDFQVRVNISDFSEDDNL